MKPWSNIEVELTVADYFSMLILDLSGKNYTKSEHRKNLLPLLSNQTEASIEFKHQNISAVLVNLGQPYLKGYLPRFNYQKILAEKVIGYLQSNLSIENLFKEFAEGEILSKVPQNDFRKFVVSAPDLSANIEDTSIVYYTENPIKINYLEKEQQNRNIGLIGEEIVLNYEKWHFNFIGKENLADQVRWVSKEDGDGLGFDILSRNLDGTDKYIEVKTTKLGKDTPFFFSRNEFLFSKSAPTNYHLYRIFNIENNAKMFIKTGILDEISTSVPVSFKGYF